MNIKDPTPADTIDVMGAVAFALASTMPDVQRSTFVKNLEALAKFAERDGKLRVMAALQQVAQAARMTPP